MFLKRAQIEKFRVLENVDLQFEQNFMIISEYQNGR